MKSTDPEIVAARLSAVEVLLYSLAQAVPHATLASKFAEQKAHSLSALRNSAVADKIVEHVEQSLSRYEKALGL